MPISVTIPARQPEIKKQEVPAFEFTIKNQSLIKEGDTVVFFLMEQQGRISRRLWGVRKNKRNIVPE